MENLIKNLKENLSFIVLVIVISIFVNSIAMVNHVVGSSMYPTFKDGNLLFSTKIVNKVDRGDIVAIHSSALREDIIKRVVAIPGDTISYIDGALIVNGETIKEDYINQKEELNTDFEIDKITLGKDTYIVMGDNRNHSSDSRHFGLIKKSEIFGRILFKIY